MSRSRHQTHGMRCSKKSLRNPRPDRNRKHKPYGLHRTRYIYEILVKKHHWSLDSQEYADTASVQNKAMARREGKKIINEQLNENI